jgi:hypothetical protein
MTPQEMDVKRRLAADFAALREESEVPARRESVALARAAMYRALTEEPERLGLLVFVDRFRRVLSLHRVLAGAAGATLALSAVTALGWNAPAGTPLHMVEVAHEQLSLAFPGTDRAAADLGYAEARLDQAARGTAESDALDEAQRLLDDARNYLPPDHTAAIWARWQTDSNRLVALRATFEHEAQAPVQSPAPASSAAPAADSRETTSESTSASRSGEERSSSQDSAEHHGDTTTTAAPAGDGHGGHSTSSTTTSSGHGGVPEPTSTPHPEH